MSNTPDEREQSPMSSGWQGDIQGHIKNTETWIRVKTIQIDLDADTAYALCNLLSGSALEKGEIHLEKEQVVRLKNLGAAIGKFIDHPSKDNLKRKPSP